MKTQTATIPFTVFGFRVFLSGPASAPAGEDIAYVVEYQRVSQLNSTGLVIIYNEVNASVPPQPAATLVSVKALVGAPPTSLVPQAVGFSEDCEFGGDTGKLEIVVRPTAGFSGPLTVELYVRGSSMEFPTGSVSQVTTRVS
jgi:hypothetical protein